MAWWDDVASAVAAAAEAVGDTVEAVVNVAAEVVGDVVETAGNLVQDGLNAIAGNGPLSGIAGWLGGIVSGVAKLLVANVIKGAWGLVGGLVGGLIKLLGGLITGHWDLALRGLVDIVSSFLGGFLSVAAALLSLIQTSVPFKSDERPLTKKEKDVLKNVFRDSLALYNIRIKNTSGIQLPITLGNTIYWPDLSIPMHLLVHECVHVWQYQNLGYRYLVDALGAQTIYGRSLDPAHACDPGNAYDWLAELGRGTTKWEYFNKEAAAQLIQEIWTDGQLKTVTEGRILSVDTTHGAFYRMPVAPEDAVAELFGVDDMFDWAGDDFGDGYFLVEEFIADDNPPSVPGRFDSTELERIHCPRDGQDHTLLAIDSVKKLRSAWNFRPSRLL